jgi:uncharacterized membrane protein YeaQ/YmgE (transglycosylase-associated protein family)
MNIITWMLAGAVIGWAAYAVLHYNEARGMRISMAIGAMGGVAGGKVVAPMFVVDSIPEAFSMAALICALASAAVVLFLGDKVHARFGCDGT